MSSDYADKLNARIVDFYKQYGLRNTVALGKAILNCKKHKDDEEFRTAIHGEICESILECCVLDFIRRNKLEKKWFYSKGLVLKDLDNLDSDYKTEIDFIIFTPHKMVPIECKSYGGRKYIKEKCLIVRPGKKPYDVYRQHEKHYEILIQNFQGFRDYTEESNKYSIVQLGMFNFSNGELTDQREELWQKTMPIVDVDNINEFLSKQLDKPGLWNMKELRRAVRIVEKNNMKRRKEHLKYVKGLADKRRRG